jgi:hypothetical protein
MDRRRPRGAACTRLSLSSDDRGMRVICPTCQILPLPSRWRMTLNKKLRARRARSGVIGAVQSHSKKYSGFPNTQIALYRQPSRPTEGRIRIVRDAGRDAVDAGSVGRVTGSQGGFIIRERSLGTQDERCCCVRQKRVVLAPHGWRQVSRRRSRPNRASGQPLFVGRR